MATIDSLSQLITNLQQQVATNTTNLTSRINDCEDDIDTINAEIVQLQNEDQQLHEEIHQVADQADNNSARLSVIENRGYQTQITNLTTQLDSATDNLQEQIDDMDEEHHQELHLLANSIDIHTQQINKLQVDQAELPDHIVLSEEEYEDLGTPDPNKIYMVYEEE